jgi:hypothetical protein
VLGTVLVVLPNFDVLDDQNQVGTSHFASDVESSSSLLHSWRK